MPEGREQANARSYTKDHHRGPSPRPAPARTISFAGHDSPARRRLRCVYLFRQAYAQRLGQLHGLSVLEPTRTAQAWALT